jgi:hypothetical protein
VYLGPRGRGVEGVVGEAWTGMNSYLGSKCIHPANDDVS